MNMVIDSAIKSIASKARKVFRGEVIRGLTPFFIFGFFPLSAISGYSEMMPWQTLMVSQKVWSHPLPSFPRRRESSAFNWLWTPACAGVTIFWTFCKFINFQLAEVLFALALDGNRVRGALCKLGSIFLHGSIYAEYGKNNNAQRLCREWIGNILMFMGWVGAFRRLGAHCTAANTRLGLGFLEMRGRSTAPQMVGSLVDVIILISFAIFYGKIKQYQVVFVS